MKELLKNTIPFQQVWVDSVESQPNSEIGYIRADHDGYRWWNTVWSRNNKLATKELIQEFDAVYAAFCTDFLSLEAVKALCSDFAQPTSDPTEFNVYLVGKYGYYWMRLITRKGDYNLYLHCYSRAVIAEFEKENADLFTVPDTDIFTAEIEHNAPVE